MSQYVDENIYPNSAVVYIEARWGDQRFFGSGFFSGINDVMERLIYRLGYADFGAIGL